MRAAAAMLICTLSLGGGLLPGPVVANETVGSPSDGFRTRQNAARGAAAGAVGGTVLGLASCGPFLGGPPIYFLCAVTGMTVGLIGGAIASGVADGIARSAPHDAVTFEETLLRIAQEPENTAIAVAIDPERWAWGTAGSAATEDQAAMLALYRCQTDASQKGVAGPCAIYSVNGQPFFVELK